MTAPLTAATGEFTLEARQAAADRVLAPIVAYPEQRRALEKIASSKLACLQANRRAGKTQGLMRWVLAKMLATPRQWSCVVISRYLSGPSETMLDNGKPDCMVELIRQLGLMNRCRIQRTRGMVRSIRFEWGAQLTVIDTGSLDALDKIRGTAADLYWADEAQSQPLLALMLTAIVGPALADQDAQIVLSGTPSGDTDSFFRRISLGLEPDWERIELWSWNNPHFGASPPERWRYLMRTSILPLRGQYGITAANENQLRELDERELRAIAHGDDAQLTPEVREVLKQVTADFLREYFGRWILRASEYVFAWHHKNLYYARVSGEDGPEPVGDTMAARLALLPRRAGRRWRVGVGMDLGTTSAAAWVVMAFAEDHATAYELWSEKQEGLDDAEMFARLKEILAELELLGVEVVGVVADNKGMRLGTHKQWDRALRGRMPQELRVPKAIATHGRQMAVNLDLASNRIRVVRGSPLDVEGRNLKWYPQDPAKPTPAKPWVERQITLPDGRLYRPGDHALDALCYAMQDLEHIWSQEPENEQEPTAAEIRRMADVAHARQRQEMRRRAMASPSRGRGR
jgi:hypothetical protein